MVQLGADTTDAPRALVEELLNTGLTITDLLAWLLAEVPDAETSEDGETVIARVVDACRPALAGVPAEDCLTAQALLRAIGAHVLRALPGPPDA
jgi:hypothetical protein